MTVTTTTPIQGLAEFLAHAIVLEHESVERYEQLADSMETHNNLEVANLFRKLADLGSKHAREVERRAAGIELPQISPWEFKWSCPEGPETSCFEDAHYLMTTRQALGIALHNEQHGRDFYTHVASSSPDPEVRRLSALFAQEEHDHIELLHKWLVNLSDPDVAPPEDLDPPNVTD